MTSYDYFKGIGLTPQALPRSEDLARAYLDIDGNGVPELFSAQGLYSFSQTPLTATPARFMFTSANPTEATSSCLLCCRLAPMVASIHAKR